MTEVKKQRYNNAYNKANYTGVSFRLNSRTEQDVIDALKNVENMKEYLVKLIRADQKRRNTKAGRVFNNGDRKTHVNVSKYPFEVIEYPANNDRYTVGFADCFDNAQAMLATYASRQKNAGPLKILQRSVDVDEKGIRSVYAVEVSF